MASRRTYSEAFGKQEPGTPERQIKKNPFDAKSPGTPYSPAVQMEDLSTPQAKKMAQEATDSEERASKARKGIKGGRKTKRRSHKRRQTHKKRR